MSDILGRSAYADWLSLGQEAFRALALRAPKVHAALRSLPGASAREALWAVERGIPEAEIVAAIEAARKGIGGGG